jgi:hypothetical protein
MNIEYDLDYKGGNSNIKDYGDDRIS